ncbi:vacuolar protein sorting-associated protein 13B isoform X1 [Drosophila willistoni]|uniref:vacuolar protein sorting-associated protein 13B isoform X1 n=1 Tax=Drosophila willistoni TaxID=7260 RepID=UPI000C26CF86|nr:vacuolar protein sorting-associated protein 13B isoform X1 [Drosophila willistoni]
MFKLESYITPILLNYVAKYVKNFRDEDAQVSLWEGEVTFHNLDLRLDVLEEELNLPVELVSGHIHELSIQVPWTKLMSEPVKIVINTIEFVAKLPDDASRERRQNFQREQLRKARRSAETPEPATSPTGAGVGGSSVVNKIINNITLQCHNIILKYVEDDIVVSMNVQCLTFSSANDKWQSAMVDVHPVSVFIRKLLEISDLTICLDKRNTAGKIEVCQEPVLYRCTLQCRVLRKYNAHTASTSSTTRIGVFTKALDINVSSLQFPMVIKLIKMLLELKPNEMHDDLLNLDDPDETANDPNDPQDRNARGESQSMLWWAWNLLPSFESQTPAPSADEILGHVFDLGIYAEQLNFQLKNSEYFTDQAMGGMKRIRYSPILRISLGGIYYERSQLKENDWTNVKAGLSSISMEPLGAYRSEDIVDRKLINTQEFVSDRSFTDKSLFDQHYLLADRVWCSHNYDDYIARHTDEYMLFRSPVLAFDVVEYRAPIACNKTQASDHQSKDMGLRVQYRLLSSGITFHFSQSFLQVKNVISDLLRPYDYPGYHSDSKIISPEEQRLERDRISADPNATLTFADFEYLIGIVPTCTFKIELRNMIIQFYPRQQHHHQQMESSSPSATGHHYLSTTVKQSLLPYLQLKLPLAEGTLCGPANPKRLVQLITQLKDKPREVIDSCYSSYKFNVKNLQLMALNTTPEMGKAKLLNIPRMQISFNRLLLPHLWRPNDAALDTAEIQAEIVSLEFSKRELILVSRMIPLMLDYNSANLCGLAHLVAQASASSDVIKLQTLATKFRLNYRKYHSHLALLISLRSLNTDAYHTMMNIRNVVISTNKGLQNKFLEMQLQYPLLEHKSDPNTPVTVVCIWMEPIRVTMDMYLLQFLNFLEHSEQNNSIENDLEPEQETLSQSGISTFSMASPSALPLSDYQQRRTSRNLSRKISVPEETVHLSSERDEKHTQAEPVISQLNEECASTTSGFNVAQLINQLRSMVILVEIAQAKIDVCEVMLRKSSATGGAVEYTSIRLPRVKIKSSNCEVISRGNIMTTIQMSARENTNWVIELNDLNVCYRQGDVTEVVVAPIKTTITVALSHKLDDLKSVDSEQSLTQEQTPSNTDEFSVDSDNFDKTPLDKEVKKKVDWHKKADGQENDLKNRGSCSINVHVDMSAINIYAQKIKLLHEHYQIFNEIYRTLRVHEDINPVADNEATMPRKPKLEVYTGSAQNYPVIKEFLTLDPNYEPPAKQNVAKNQMTLILFCQWTIPRISLEMESIAVHKKRKIVIIFEDLLLNVDKHTDFTKITSKVENLGLDYYEDDWEKKDGFHIKMLGDNSNLPLISTVITMVSLQDLYSKIGARNHCNKEHTISEVLIDVQPIEMVLDLDQITEFIIPLCEVFEIIRSTNNDQSVDTHQVLENSITTVQDLPMVHLNCKGIYVYIPMETGKKCCSVLILRVESVKLTPSPLENPLVRQLIRQDIYHKAAELNMLNTPGALVEDRQYELSVKNISLSSGNWLQTQKYYQEEKRASEHSNPAFEWNNQQQSKELQHTSIFKDFDFIMIYAPAVSYDRFLVCGQNIEYNCVTDFVATLTTHQINLMSCIIVRIQRLQSIFEQVCIRESSLARSPGANAIRRKDSEANSFSVRLSDFSLLQYQPGTKNHQVNQELPRLPKNSKRNGSKETVLGSCFSDSGIQMAPGKAPIASSHQKLIEIDPKFDRHNHSYSFTYPKSVSFVAGSFVLKIYDVLEIDDIEKPVMNPLLLLTVSQPSFMSTQNLRSAITQASIFDFNISVGNAGVENVSDTVKDQFSDAIFETLPGMLNSSKIPPPLLTIKTHIDRSHQKEIDVELGKPIIFRFCESKIKQLACDVIKIYTVLHESPCFAVRSERPVVSQPSKLSQLKLQCYNADRLHLSFDGITVKFYDEDLSYKCSVVCLDFSSRIKFNARPQKASIRSTLGAFYIKSGDKIMLHPLLMRLSADLLSEPWCDQLLITATLKLNLLHIDASILNILQLRKVQGGLQHIMEFINTEWQQFLRHRPVLGEPIELAPETLLRFTPSQDSVHRSRNHRKNNAEFYQDDLRAGAFQFVHLNSESVLPMPYQVQIIKKNYGIICWRYPQPRQMTKIHIYPVPMPVSNPVHISCRMEYFSETHETFLHYCDFELSETTTKQLDPPPEHQICANIWRVVIMQSLISVDGTCFEGDEDEDIPFSIDSSRMDFGSDNGNDFILHPRVLVGCLRIDTTFREEAVPKLQLLLCCQDIQVNFLNQPDAHNELPPLLQNYNLKRTTEIGQTFLTVHFEDLQFHSTILSRNEFTMETNFRSRIKCLDYGFLNMIDIVEPMKFQSYARFNNRERMVQANFLIDKLRINCGPCVIHTLLSSKQHWEELLQQRDKLHTLMPKCVIVNRMQAYFTFGQTGTSERITVAPQELQLYHFRSDYLNQELTFFIRNPLTEQMETSDSVHIPLKLDDDHNVQHLRVGERCITIKVGKLSATQVYILVKGQIELLSMLPYELLTEFRQEGKQYNDNSPLEHLLEAKGRASFYQAVVRSADVNMRIRLGPGRGKGRTGDIPLKPNNNLPWLVKVPTQSTQQFISVWVRVLREDIALDSMTDDFQPQRIYITIWPIFEICNMLSCQLKAVEYSTEEEFELNGQGARQALSTATTHTTEHRVNFQFSAPLSSTSQAEYTFMLKNMDWHKFFYFDPAHWTIEEAIQKLGKPLKPKWPLNDHEEIRINRHMEFLNEFDVQYFTQATREFSCTLGLDIRPWGTFINATGLDISIYVPKKRARHHLRANCLEMVPTLSDLFTIDVPYSTSWTQSTAICLEELVQSVGTSNSNSGRYVVLRPNAYVDIVIVRNEEIFRMLLEYKLENGQRIFKLRSKFVCTNFTDIKLHALPLAMDHKENSSREEINSLDSALRNRNLISVDKTQNCIGNNMDIFYDLNARKVKHTSETAFVYFVCFSVSGCWDVSIPISLAMPITRRCFSLQSGSESIPLMITLIEKDNVYYLNVYQDTAPAIILTNNTNIKFIVAQTSASGNSNVTCTTSENVGKHFEWNQLVAPHSKCYYTPPQMYANFPDVEFTMCNLSLAVFYSPSCDKKKIGWSKPIRTDKSWTKLLHVPNHGDVKVVVCDKHRVIRVNIYYIAQQLEFSVKDLRSRLKMPEKLNDVNDLLESNRDSTVDPPVVESEASDVICAHFSQECETKRQMKIRVFVKRFVFSLQTDSRDKDYLKTEVCNVYADDTMLAFDDDDDQRILRLQLPNLQVDNQLFSSGKYDFPVLLCADQLYRRFSGLPQVFYLDSVYQQQQDQSEAVSWLSFVFYEDEFQLQAVRCKFQPFRVYIEDAYLNQLLETLVECEPSNCVYTPCVQEERIVLAKGQTLLPEEVIGQGLCIAEPLLLNSFTVEPLSLLLSVHTSSRLYIALDHSPLSFSRYERQQILTVPLRFGQSLGLHYLSGAIFGAGWVVGSLEILGSPSGLARSFSTGLRDFISMPVQGLFRGPWGFLVGVTQGSASLLRNVTAGTVNSVTKLAGSVARNLDRLTLDAEHIELTEARRRARPQGFADGLTQGLTGLGISLLGAVGGLAHHTLEARSSVGVIAGLTKGIVGAFTKPISGAAEMLALTGQGVLHTVGFNAMPQQVEPSVTRNVALHAGSYRVWRYLPEELSHDQILFFYEITLLVNGHLRPALIFLTSSILAIMEQNNDDLAFASSVLKVELVADREDPTKLYLSLKPEPTDDLEGQLNYTNERIMKFLNSSTVYSMTHDSLSDLLQLQNDVPDERIQRQTQCIFYIKPNIGEHLIHYLKLISRMQS